MEHSMILKGFFFEERLKIVITSGCFRISCFFVFIDDV